MSIIRAPFLAYRCIKPPLVVTFVHKKNKIKKYALLGANGADRNRGVTNTTVNMMKWSSRHDPYAHIRGRGIPLECVGLVIERIRCNHYGPTSLFCRRGFAQADVCKTNFQKLITLNPFIGFS